MLQAAWQDVCAVPAWWPGMWAWHGVAVPGCMGRATTAAGAACCTTGEHLSRVGHAHVWELHGDAVLLRRVVCVLQAARQDVRAVPSTR